MIESTGEAKLRELADLEAIRDLGRRYAHCVWQKDVPGAIALFTDDAEMDTGDRPPIIGRADLLKSYEEMFAANRSMATPPRVPVTSTCEAWWTAKR